MPQSNDITLEADLSIGSLHFTSPEQLSDLVNACRKVRAYELFEQNNLNLTNAEFLALNAVADILLFGE